MIAMLQHFARRGEFHNRIDTRGNGIQRQLETGIGNPRTRIIRNQTTCWRGNVPGFYLAPALATAKRCSEKSIINKVIIDQSELWMVTNPDR